MLGEAVAAIGAMKTVYSGLKIVRDMKRKPKERKAAAMDVYAKTLKHFIFRWDTFVETTATSIDSVFIMLDEHSEAFMEIAVELDGIIGDDGVRNLITYAKWMKQMQKIAPTMTRRKVLMQESEPMIKSLKDELATVTEK